MKRFVSILLVGFVFYFVYVQALECGIAENMGEETLQSALRKCMAKNASDSQEKANKDSTESSKSSEESQHEVTGARRGFNSRARRAIFHVNFNDRLMKRDTTSSSGNDGDTKAGQSNNDTTLPEKCFLQCIFTNLGMADENGFPNHERVAQGLLKHAQGRELRDFIQDSTDECFQLMEQGDKLESCEYATHLVTCLSEKGRSNCADWKITNLPFHN